LIQNEVVLLLQVAGFGEITMRGDYGEESATPDSKELSPLRSAPLTMSLSKRYSTAAVGRLVIDTDGSLL
jgi:hypothetical protein